MSSQVRPTRMEIAKAAMMRAAGLSWEEIAAEFGRSAGRVRHWPIEFPKPWIRHFRLAELRFAREAAAEAVQVLHYLARHGDEYLRRAAARELAQPHLQPVAPSALPEAAIHNVTGSIYTWPSDEQPKQPAPPALIRVYEGLDQALDELADRLIARQREERADREERENAAMHTGVGEFTAFNTARN